MRSKNSRTRTSLWLAALATIGTGMAHAQNLQAVPGVVVSQQATGQGIYVGSPSITIMPNGDYIASHDLFGSGSTEKTSGVTKIFRSHDQGQTWAPVSTLTDQFWSTIFQHDGQLYIWGYRNSGTTGDILIRRSSDYGSTWTTPADSTSGLLRDGDYGGTPSVPAIHAGRLWLGQGTRVMSVPLGADMLNAASWTLSNAVSQNTSWLNGTFTFWSEGQVVASPQTGVVMLPKIFSRSNTALIRANSTTGSITFDASSDFVDLPGGDKKFGAQYDPVSGKFYILNNPVLPAHANDPTWGDTPELIRNTAALLSSKDLRHWDVERVFLYSPHIDYEGFQYLNFVIDGDDLAVISRTAFDVGGIKPPRGHDSNLMTFHRIEDFRQASSRQLLVADTNHNQVLRYELTQSNWLAPLGRFTLGSTFAGAGLIKPMGLAQAADGDVYIGEEVDGGRILRFDALGNFKGVIATEGVDFVGRPEALALRADGTLYMSVAFGADSDRIYTIDPSTRQVSLLVDTSFRGGTLNNPRGLTVAPDGSLYVADRENNVIRRFDAATGTFLGDIFVGDRPQEVIWSEKLNALLVANRGSGDTDLFSLTLAGTSSKLYDPADIGAALGIEEIDGQIFWSDFDNNRIYKLLGTDQKFTSVATGLSGPGHLMALEQPAHGERAWTRSGSGTWSDLLNWYYWGRPDTNYEIANFGSAIDAEAVVTLDGPVTVKGVRFRSDNRYRISGLGTMTILADSGGGVIEVQQGSHELGIPLWLESCTTMTVAADSRITLAADMNAAAGAGLTKNGPGTAVVTRIRAAALNVDDGLLQVSSKRLSDTSGTCVVTSLSIADTSAVLDLTTNSMIIDYTGQSPLHGVRQLLRNDRIVTSAPTLPGGRLGYGESSRILGGAGAFAGQAVDATSVLMRYTTGGDANLDGLVDITDLGALATAWQTAGVWNDGDFNYDGLIDITDLGILATHWQGTASGSAALPIEMALPLLGLPVVQVPEPAALALIGAAALASRRSRLPLQLPETSQ